MLGGGGRGGGLLSSDYFIFASFLFLQGDLCGLCRPLVWVSVRCILVLWDGSGVDLCVFFSFGRLGL